MTDADPRKAIHSRYGLPAGASERRWGLYHSRFDLAREPNEPFRFGRVVTRRTEAQVDAANPRANNRHGHIIELTEDHDDPTSLSFTWEIFILCGDPANPDDDVFFAGFDPSFASAISSPDNIIFDNAGNLWITTDGQPSTFQQNDGIYAVPVEGPERGYCRQFLSGVVDGEIASLIFSPDNQALFCAIQHPAEGTTIDNPSSTWPDGTTPPRPSVIVVEKSGGGVIGS